MGYQESLFYIRPQRHVDKMVRAYEKAEYAGYYEVAGAKPRSVIVLKQPAGELPAGTRLLWVCGDRSFHSPAGAFGGQLHTGGKIDVIPVEKLFDGPEDPRLSNIDLDSPQTTENDYLKRYSADHYAYRIKYDRER